MDDWQEQVRRWRMMAAECRTKAEAIQDAGARGSFLHMAQTYDSMAARFEQPSETAWLGKQALS
ncbi:MAG: hypothetical protein HYR63_15590 [Proteobacteria bacterium]|nr:hypothetical protein [Pseudomonadota bacterium]MBI3499716.1 hypothetical protein [Pseudomonadota bacterium]